MPREDFLTLPQNSARNQKRVYERRIQIVNPKSLKGGGTIDRYAARSGKLERLDAAMILAWSDLVNVHR
jgi:hypothetical protein